MVNQGDRRAAAGRILDLRVLISGIINGRDLRATGTGKLDEASGKSVAEIDIEELTPEVNPMSLGAFLFTGYPNSCDCSEAGVENPFIGDRYEYRRRYEFSDSATVLLDMKCEVSRGELMEAHFHLEGKMPTAACDAVSVSPIYELWSAMSGTLFGGFSVAWQDSEGDSVMAATTSSTYSIPNSDVRLHQFRPVFRHIDLKVSSVRTLGFRVDQTSALIPVPQS